VGITEIDVSGLKDQRKQSWKRGNKSPKGSSEPTAGSVCVDTMDTDVSVINDQRKEPCKERGESFKVFASVLEGDAEPIASSEHMDSMETDVSFLKDTHKPQYGRALHSGRRRGRRCRGPRGCSRSHSAHHVLNRGRELEESSEDSSTVQVWSLCCNDDNENE
jgi:hypothetical protein